MSSDDLNFAASFGFGWSMFAVGLCTVHLAMTFFRARLRGAAAVGLRLEPRTRRLLIKGSLPPIAAKTCQSGHGPVAVVSEWLNEWQLPMYVTEAGNDGYVGAKRP